MRFGSLILYSLIGLTAAIPAAASSHKRHAASLSKASAKPASRSAFKSASKSSARHAPKPKILGQRTIDDDRATEIQTALIKAGYLTGNPSGHWDSESEAAMQKLQADSGWQTKLVPDSRALIKLGLGPATTSSSTPGTAPGSTPGSPSGSSRSTPPDLPAPPAGAFAQTLQ